MIRILRQSTFIALLILAFSHSVPAAGSMQPTQIPDQPQYRLYWNQFSALVNVDGLLIGLAKEGMVTLSYDPSVGTFRPEFFEPTDAPLVAGKIVDSLLIVRDDFDRLLVYDATLLPQFIRLFIIDPPEQYSDFGFNDGNLYISRWFDGIWKYAVDDEGKTTFVDSTMRPILSTQLLIENDTLYVLDHYNGLARFDLTDGSFGAFAGNLFSPRKVVGFDKLGDTFALALSERMLYLGQFGRVGSGIIDSLIDVDYIDRTFATDTYLVLQSERYLEFVRRDNPLIRQRVDILWFLPTGVQINLEGRPTLALPNVGLGGMLFDLVEPGLKRPLLFRPGPINHLLFAQDYFLTAGRGNPIDVFRLDSDNPLEPQYSIFQQFSDIRGLATNGDTLYAIFGEIGRLGIIPAFNDPESLDVEVSIPVDTTNLFGVKFSDRTFDGWSPIMLSRLGRIDVYATRDTILAEFKASWRIIGEPLDFIVDDSLLVIATAKKELLLYRIFDDLTVQFRSAFALTDLAERITPIGANRALVWARNRIFVLNFGSLVEPHMDTVVNLPFAVSDATVTGDLAFSIGPDGVAVFQLLNGVPQLLYRGGIPATRIAVQGENLVTTDGTFLAIYKLPPPPPKTDESDDATALLASNYPNPFNLGTTIRYHVPTDGRVEVSVFNSLGQKVTTLVNEWQSEGMHEVAWDGRSTSGNVVASGVYFLRIVTGSEADSHKMMLLK